MNSRGSETPTGPRKYDVAWSSTGIKISAARAYKNKGGGTVKSRLNSRKVIPNALGRDEIYLEILV
jgi:hypothetical protein